MATCLSNLYPLRIVSRTSDDHAAFSSPSQRKLSAGPSSTSLSGPVSDLRYHFFISGVLPPSTRARRGTVSFRPGFIALSSSLIADNHRRAAGALPRPRNSVTGFEIFLDRHGEEFDGLRAPAAHVKRRIRLDRLHADALGKPQRSRIAAHDLAPQPLALQPLEGLRQQRPSEFCTKAEPPQIWIDPPARFCETAVAQQESVRNRYAALLQLAGKDIGIAHLEVLPRYHAHHMMPDRLCGSEPHGNVPLVIGPRHVGGEFISI